MTKNFTTMKVGDKVAKVYRAGFRNRLVKMVILDVTKVTPTQFTAGGLRFMRNTGIEVGQGSSRHSDVVVPVTAELIAEVEFDKKIMNAESKLRMIADKLERLRDEAALDAFSKMPPEILALVE